MIRRHLLLSAGLVGLAAAYWRPTNVFAGSVSAVGNGQMRQVSGEDLRRLVVGAAIGLDAVRSDSRSSERGEQFLADGRYVLLGDRAAVEGRYRIVGDELCITQERRGAPPQECRIILKSDDGGLYFARSGSSADRRPWPIQIERLDR